MSEKENILEPTEVVGNPSNQPEIVERDISDRIQTTQDRLSATETTIQDITALVFQNDKLLSIEELSERYPARVLPEGANVTRIAPSPTGFIHVGGIYTAMISQKLAAQSDGCFFLRIEDTDKKREVEGASDLIGSSLARYGIVVDEGDPQRSDNGLYGPYVQSERTQIYNSYIKHLLDTGGAYICFATPEELEGLRMEQQQQQVDTGYYGKWANWRDADPREVIKNLKAEKPYVIRLKSPGAQDAKVFFKDEIKGRIDMPEAYHDIVIRKADGLPTYHFAHAVDDHLMGTNLVIRGDEWLASVPLHLQLFEVMGWEPPKYAHIAPICKIDNESRRKLSKRKDPEADVRFYQEAGYPEEGVIEYLVNLANSNFEDWRKKNPDSPNEDFKLSLKVLAKSKQGPLFDLQKLASICKEVIGRYNAEQVYSMATAWAEKYDPELYELLTTNRDYAVRFFNIDRDRSTTRNIRKDIGKWSDLRKEIGFYFDELFYAEQNEESTEETPQEDRNLIIGNFLDSYDPTDDASTWFQKIQTIASDLGYALKRREFNEHPEKFKGQITDVVNVIRVAITGKSQTPDLFTIMQVMGERRVRERLERATQILP